MTQVREHWSSRLGFLMAAIGSAIGLGILWKFPYVVGQNGGGLFLITYFICLLIVGLPLFIGELLLGRGSQKAAVSSFTEIAKEGHHWKIGGWLGVLASFLIMSFYSVISGYGMSYILMSLNGFYKGLDASQIAATFDTLSKSGDITTFWHFLFTLITMGIVCSGVRKGIEYWAKIMVQILLVLLVGLFIYSTTLEGFPKAVAFIFQLNPQNFTVNSVIEALGLAFWTLSIGQGIMISYGSYMKPTQNVVKTAAVVGSSVIIAAILAALMIFPVVFTFGLSPSAGPGLVFKTLPFLFAQLPGAMVISTLFFTLFVFTALTSAIPLIEVVAANLMELYGLSRVKATICVSIATFVFGIPSAYAASGGVFENWVALFGMDFLETVNQFVSIWVIPICGLITSIFIGWKIDKDRLKKEFELGQERPKLFFCWRFFVRYVVPFTILIIILQTSGILSFEALIKGGK
ncbi:MAG: sodium-dependent transporter [Chlamydiales bacterium]|nr:sodium-dependent transporter [Chlamydiales bacterium]